MKLLEQLGVDYGQGFHLGPPRSGGDAASATAAEALSVATDLLAIVLIDYRYRRGVVTSGTGRKIGRLRIALVICAASALASQSAAGRRRTPTQQCANPDRAGTDAPSRHLARRRHRIVRRCRITVALAPRRPCGVGELRAGGRQPRVARLPPLPEPAEFRARFAPSQTRRSRKVEAALRSRGLHPGSLTANGLAIHVCARAARRSSTLSR